MGDETYHAHLAHHGLLHMLGDHILDEFHRGEQILLTSSPLKYMILLNEMLDCDSLEALVDAKTVTELRMVMSLTLDAYPGALQNCKRYAFTVNRCLIWTETGFGSELS